MIEKETSAFEVLAESKSLRVIDAGREKRRSMIDVIDVLRSLPNFSESMEAVVRIMPFQLPSGQWTALVQVVCETQGFAVSLPSATHFLGARNPILGLERFEIPRLDGAKADAAGNLTLPDATIIHGARVVPTFVPPKLSPFQERIVVWTIRLFHPRKRCFRYLPNLRILHPLRRQARLGWLDYSTLPSLKLPSLKEIEYALKDIEELGDCSRQAIASALARAGMRPRSTRHSRKRI